MMESNTTTMISPNLNSDPYYPAWNRAMKDRAATLCTEVFPIAGLKETGVAHTDAEWAVLHPGVVDADGDIVPHHMSICII